MGSGGCTNELVESRFQSQKSLEKLGKESDLGVEKDATEPPVKLVVDEMASLGPITPIANRENGELPVAFNSLPSILKKPSNVARLDSNCNRNGDDSLGHSDDNSSPRTPVDGVFDPFAPGRSDLLLAPRCEKYVSKSWTVVARQLNFDSPVQTSSSEVWTDVESISDEEIFEAVYENLLEAIVSEQTEGVVGFAKRSRKDWDCDDCKTPSPELRLSGVAESCPGAPLRPLGKSRNIDSSFIRKLEF